MKILMVSDVYFPRINGVSTSIQTFRHELAQLGVQSQLIAPAYPGAGASMGGDGEAGVIRVPARRVPFDPEDRLMGYRACLDQLEGLQGAGFDLVHIQTPFVAHYAGLKLAKALDIPVVASYHTFFEEYLHHYARFLPAAWTRGLARRFSRQQCNAYNRVYAPSTAMRDALLGYGVSTPIEVLPTGINLLQFSQGDRARFRARHGILPQQQVALFVGRVAFEKNIGLLLQALAQLAPAQPDSLLLIAGEGPALPALQRQAAELGIARQVRFVGYLERDQALADCYAAADCFVFASVTETQGLVLLEALAAGLPVLAVPAMGAADIVKAGHGCVPAEATVADFAGKLAQLLADADYRRLIASTAQAAALRWGAGRQAQQLLQSYQQLLGHPTAATPRRKAAASRVL